VARGGSRGRRNYTRDNSGRFSSTPGGGPSRRTTPKVRRGALKPSGGTLTARARLRAAKAKLTPGASRQQKAAVTRAANRLKAAKQPVRLQLGTPSGRIRVKSPRKRQQQAPPQTPPKATPRQQGRQPNARAQRAKAMAERRGTVAGRNFQDGQARQTLSLREMRAAVRKELRRGGIETRKQFEAVYGKPPTTRSGWERLYRENVAVPQSDRGRKGRPGVINGIDIQKQFRPWQVFGLNPKTATRDDVNRAFRRLALQNHPDVGGRRKDMERLQKMRDSVLAQMPKPKPPKGSKPAKGGGRKGKGSKAAPAAPQGPKLLPPARETAKPTSKTGKQSPKSEGTKAKAKVGGAKASVRKVTTDNRAKADLMRRAKALRLAFEERRQGEKRRSNAYVGRAAQGAEYANFFMPRVGGSTQLERAAIRAGRRYAVLTRQFNNTTNPKEKRALKARLDLAWRAFASYPKTKFSWNM